jgi:hypothetical protein
MSGAPPPPPSFKPWLARVRMARAWAAVVGFVVVTGLSRGADYSWLASLWRGFAGATVLYFVAWASALWLFGELYHAQLHQVRRQRLDREAARQAQLQQMYEQRLRELHGLPADAPVAGLTHDNVPTQPFDPMQPASPSGYAPPLRDAA